MEKTQPKYLNLSKIKLPIPGIISILHRITSMIIFVSLPMILFLFSGTLNKNEYFNLYIKLISMPIVKILLLILLWSFIHHCIAGTRFLFLDIHKGLELKIARITAKLVLLSSLLLTLIIGTYLW